MINEVAVYRKNLQLSINKVVQAFPYLENFSTLKAVIAGKNPEKVLGARIGMEIFEELARENNSGLMSDKSKVPTIQRNLRLTKRDKIKQDGRSSIFGTPIILPITLGELEMPAATIITTVQGGRKVNMTDVQGKDFSVIETSGLENYKINMKGVATSVEVMGSDKAERFPTYWVRNFRKLIEQKGSIEVKSDLMTLFNIKYLQMKSFNFDFQIGTQGWFAFDIDFINDDNVELELWKEDIDASNTQGELA